MLILPLAATVLPLPPLFLGLQFFHRINIGMIHRVRREFRRWMQLHFVGHVRRLRRWSLRFLSSSLSFATSFLLPPILRRRCRRGRLFPVSPLSSLLAIFASESRSTVTHVIPQTDAASIAVVAAFGAMLAALPYEALFAEAVAKRRANAAIRAFLRETGIVLQSTKLAEF